MHRALGGSGAFSPPDHSRRQHSWVSCQSVSRIRGCAFPQPEPPSALQLSASKSRGVVAGRAGGYLAQPQPGAHIPPHPPPRHSLYHRGSVQRAVNRHSVSGRAFVWAHLRGWLPPACVALAEGRGTAVLYHARVSRSHALWRAGQAAPRWSDWRTYHPHPVFPLRHPTHPGHPRRISHHPTNPGSVAGISESFPAGPGGGWRRRGWVACGTAV